MKEKSASVGEMGKSGENEIAIASEELIGNIRPLIEQARAHVAQSVRLLAALFGWPRILRYDQSYRPIARIPLLMMGSIPITPRA